jgi:Insertion element 4 transposase N-terminal
LPCSCRPRRPGLLSPTGAGEGESRLRADLASRVLSGPGLWTGWLEDLDRRGLIEELLAGGVIDQAVAAAPHGHQLDRALNAKNTVLCVLAGCLFPGEGYDGILRIAFGMPGLGLKPGTKVPTGPGLSKARVLSGEQVMRRAFELDAARTDVELGIGATWHGMETTSFDGTTTTQAGIVKTSDIATRLLRDSICRSPLQ